MVGRFSSLWLWRLELDLARISAAAEVQPMLTGEPVPRALDADRKIGLLLPCNVVVRTSGGQTIVEALNPQVMMQVAGQPALEPVADEATSKIRAALDSLQGSDRSARRQPESG